MLSFKRSLVVPRGVQDGLTALQKEQRVANCLKWLQKFEPNGVKMFSDVVTDDENWISFFVMKDKRSNMVWLVEGEPRPKVLNTSFRSRKRMFTIFFNSQGPIVVDIIPDKATITATYYTTSVLPKVPLHMQ